MARVWSRDCSRFDAPRGEWLLLAGLLASYPVSFVLPAAWSREGGLLESLQVVVLLAGALLALAAYLRMRPARPAMLALWAVPVWLLLAGRELSWGRAWLPQAGVDAAGNAVAAPPLWFQPLVWPAAALLLAWLVVSAWRYRIDLPVRAAFSRHAPWLGSAVMLAGAMGSTCAEGHMSCNLDMTASAAQLFEELSELLAYLALCAVQRVVLQHQLPAARVVPQARRTGETADEAH